MAKKISWLRDWDPQDYTGFSPNQVNNAKRIYKKLAIRLVEDQIAKLKKQGMKITYHSPTWKKDRARPFYYLLCFIKPPAIEIPKKRSGKKTTKTNGDHGGTGSNVSPTPPPKP
jgi:hypothetical protein